MIVRRKEEAQIEADQEQKDKKELNLLAPVVYLKCEESSTEAERNLQKGELTPQINGGCFRIRSSGIRIPLHNHGENHNFLQVTEGAMQQTTETQREQIRSTASLCFTYVELRFWLNALFIFTLVKLRDEQSSTVNFHKTIGGKRSKNEARSHKLKN